MKPKRGNHMSLSQSNVRLLRTAAHYPWMRRVDKLKGRSALHTLRQAWGWAGGYNPVPHRRRCERFATPCQCHVALGALRLAVSPVSILTAGRLSCRAMDSVTPLWSRGERRLQMAELHFAARELARRLHTAAEREPDHELQRTYRTALE